MASMVSLNNATEPGPGISFEVKGCRDYYLRVVFWGGNPTVVVQLQATDDPATVPDEDATWRNIVTFSTVEGDRNGGVRTVGREPAKRIRAYLKTLAGGDCSTVTANLGAV